LETSDTTPNPSPLADVDRVIHEPARLSIVALLYVLVSADFTFVMNQTGMTWGNLSSHMTKLEEAGYLEVEKTFKGKRPNTTLKLTEKGRRAFNTYRAQMTRFFEDVPD
jgi:DNA-binding MarR family transcriptional regulator